MKIYKFETGITGQRYVYIFVHGDDVDMAMTYAHAQMNNFGVFNFFDEKFVDIGCIRSESIKIGNTFYYGIGEEL